MRLSLGIVTDDLPRLRRFYEAILGPADVDLGEYVELRPATDWVVGIVTRTSIDQFAPGVHVPGTDTSVRVEIEVGDVDFAHMAALDAGGTELVGPSDFPWGNRAAWVYDPDGNVVSLWSAKVDVGPSPQRRPLLDIQGLTIEVRDLARSKHFYEDLLGFVPGEFYEPTRWQPYSFGEQFLGIREVVDSDRRSREDILNFACSDVDALWEGVRDKAEVVEPLATTPWGSYKFVLADPDGFRLGFVEKR